MFPYSRRKVRKCLMSRRRGRLVDLTSIGNRRSAISMTKSTSSPVRDKDLALAEPLACFPDDASAVAWFIKVCWPGTCRCAHGDSPDVRRCVHPTILYACRACHQRFRTKTHSVMQGSNWVDTSSSPCCSSVTSPRGSRPPDWCAAWASPGSMLGMVQRRSDLRWTYAVLADVSTLVTRSRSSPGRARAPRPDLHGPRHPSPLTGTHRSASRSLRRTWPGPFCTPGPSPGQTGCCTSRAAGARTPVAKLAGWALPYALQGCRQPLHLDM